MPSVLEFVEESELLKQAKPQKKFRLPEAPAFEPPPLEQEDIVNLLNWTSPKPLTHPEIRAQLPSDLLATTLKESPAEELANRFDFLLTRSPEHFQAIKDAIGTAFITEAEQSTVGGMVKGGIQGAGELALGFTSPENLALMATFGALGPAMKRLASTAFGVHMLSQIPEQQTEYQDALAKGRYADATRIAVNEIGTALFGAGALKHGIYGPPKLVPRITPEDL